MLVLMLGEIIICHTWGRSTQHEDSVVQVYLAVKRLEPPGSAVFALAYTQGHELRR